MTRSDKNSSYQDQLKNASDEEWQSKLTKEEYIITRKGGTERAFTGAYWNNKRKGLYHCICCNEQLFSSTQKFDSGTGWPSFSDVLDVKSINTTRDESHGMIRNEISCSNCNAHLGHVFNDGPNPTGLRYCINSASLKFKEENN